MVRVVDEYAIWGGGSSGVTVILAFLSPRRSKANGGARVSGLSRSSVLAVH